MLTSNADMVLRYMFPDAKDGDWELADMSDGNGVFVSAWNRAEPVPSNDEINAAESAAIAAAAAKVQTGKPLALKQAENRFLALCDTLTGSTTHAKLGFALLEQIIGTLPQEQQVMVGLRLLAIDAECKREGGNLWWDSAEWHSEVVEA